MKRVLFLLATGAAVFLGGCANNQNSGSLAILQNAESGISEASVYDDASIIMRNKDTDDLALDLEAVNNDRADKNSGALNLQNAEILVGDARILETASTIEKAITSARSSTSRTEQTQDDYQVRADKDYRLALKFAPNFESDNSDLLNALGYFLADRGISTQDFQTGEKLTRRSLKMWDDLVNEAQNSSIPGASQVLALRRFSRANVRDSVAWSLFRQAEYSQALKEQTEAVREAKQNASQIGQSVPPELLGHLKQIEDALENSKPPNPKKPKTAPQINPQNPPQAALQKSV